jgi:Ca2+-binding EF-hand superfamily protein
MHIHTHTHIYIYIYLDDKKEIRQLYHQFIEEAPCGYIPKIDFHLLTGLMGIKDPFITSLVFNAFDRNNDGKIQFDEFVMGMSVMTRGKPEEKLQFAFQLYDLDNDGYISKAEMVKIVTALYRMLGDLVSLQGEEYDTPAKLVDKIFKEMDTDKDGRLSFQEYKVGAQKDPAIVQGLGLF